MQLIDSLDQSFLHLGERMAVSPSHAAAPFSPPPEPHADEWAEALVDAAPLPLPSTAPASASASAEGASAPAVNLLD